jgi:F-type H+-transporting ATPase subunit gamma
VANELIAAGKTVKMLFVGRKGHDVLKREFAGNVVDVINDIGKKRVEYHEALSVSDIVTGMFEAGDFDVATIVFNKFQSVMTQIVTEQQLIPFSPSEDADAEPVTGAQPVYIYEPDEDEVITELLPRNMGIQIFQALLESSASEHGARMTAMDSATRNAGDMIDNLSLTYNRTRQAFITKELIEIISGAEAL